MACKPQDILHVVAYQQIPSAKLRCAIFGEKMNVHRWGRAQSSEKLGTSLNRKMNEMSWDVGRSSVYTDAFLSSLLKDMNASNNEYIYSRTLTKLVLEKHPDIDAIVYPGTALEGSMNFAIKPEIAHTKLKVESNFVIKINEKYDFGMYDFEIIKLACGHDFDGKIRWQET